MSEALEKVRLQFTCFTGTKVQTLTEMSRIKTVAFGGGDQGEVERAMAISKLQGNTVRET